MKFCWGRLQKIITYILVGGLFATSVLPVASQAATTTDAVAEKKTDITDDKIFEMTSSSTSLNKGDEVEVKFAVHNTPTYGFRGELVYDTDVFETLEAGELTPCNYIPNDENNQGSWIASYSPSDKSIEVRWRGNKAVTLPEDTKGVVLSIRLVVKKATELTEIKLNNPMVYKTNESSDTVTYQSGLGLRLKNTKTKKMVLTSQDVSVAGSTIPVPVSCTTNEGFLSLDLVVEFDKTKLTYQSVSVASSLKNIVSVVSYSTEAGGGKVVTHMKATQEVKNIGGLFTVNFAPVKSGGTSQTSTTVTDMVKISVENVKDQDESAFVTTGATSKVTFKLEPAMMGDINGNKKIDLVDALYNVQYYNKVRYFMEEQKTVADVNKNGTVDLVDALLIMQYYNGVIKSFP